MCVGREVMIPLSTTVKLPHFVRHALGRGSFASRACGNRRLDGNISINDIAIIAAGKKCG